MLIKLVNSVSEGKVRQIVLTFPGLIQHNVGNVPVNFEKFIYKLNTMVFLEHLCKENNFECV